MDLYLKIETYESDNSSRQLLNSWFFVYRLGIDFLWLKIAVA